MEQRTAVDVRRTEQLAHVPAAARLVGDLVLAERIRLVGEVPAEDDRVRPHVANDVRGEVGSEGRTERAPARDERRQRGEREVVLEDLPARLAADRLELRERLALRLLA